MSRSFGIVYRANMLEAAGTLPRNRQAAQAALRDFNQTGQPLKWATGEGRSPRPDPRGSSPLRALERKSFPAPLTFFTLRTRRAFAGLASIRQAPWPANATRIRTVRQSAAAGATTLRAGCDETVPVPGALVLLC